MQGSAIPILQIGADGELFVGINVGEEGNGLGRGGSLRPEAQEAVFPDVGNGDDVDDAARTLRTVPRRGVSDDLNLLDVTGRHLLQKDFEGFGVHVGRSIVKPYLYR